jgi:nanoRNase/pAp phosphatase (c-di-AMP/oligoRNAs hydrolase)
MDVLIMKKKSYEKLRQFYQQFAGSDHVLVLINADPDALGSAMAVRRLLWRKVASTTVSNINQVERPDNAAMIRLLNIALTHVDEIDPGRFSKFVVVDSQPDHNQAFARFAPTVLIDHHPDTGAEAPFRDIRPQYGATSSILTEYLRTAKIKPSSRVATGLMHGIKTDTHNFARQALFEDVQAFQYLFRYANIHLARRIEQAELRPDFLKFFRLALDNRRVRRGRVYVHLGSVPTPDICVVIADFFMRVNTISWSIISGIHDKKLIVVLRNDGIRKNAGRLVNASFGDLGSAGGHKSMARVEIPLTQIKDLLDYRDQKQVVRWISSQLRTRTGKRDGV